MLPCSHVFHIECVPASALALETFFVLGVRAQICTLKLQLLQMNIVHGWRLEVRDALAVQGACPTCKNPTHRRQAEALGGVSLLLVLHGCAHPGQVKPLVLELQPAQHERRWGPTEPKAHSDACHVV